MDRYHDWHESGCGCLVVSAAIAVPIVALVIFVVSSALR